MSLTATAPIALLKFPLCLLTLALTSAACSTEAEPPKLQDASMQDGSTGDTGTSTATDAGFPDVGLPDVGLDGGVIVDSCNPLDQTPCSVAEKCIIERGASECVQQGVNEPTYGDSCGGGLCEPGLACIGTGTGTIAVCRKICDRQTGDGCEMTPVDSDCLESVRGTNWGVCTELPPTCDPVTQAPCPQDQACQTLQRFDGSFEMRCRPAGTAQAGDPCGAERCARGLLCVNLTGGAICTVLCDNDGMCNGGTCNGTVNGVPGVQYCAP